MRIYFRLQAKIFFLVASVASADSGPSLSENARDFASDFGAYVTAPIDWGWGAWAGFGAVLVTTGALMPRDAELKNSLRERASPTYDRVMNAGDKYGEWSPIGAASLYVTSFVVQSNELNRVSRVALESYLFSGFVNSLIKYGAGRARPYVNENPHSWRGPKSVDADYMSFPSGHTVTAFSISSALASYYGNLPFGILAYSAAASPGSQECI
jgi:membrane-associated phospholipid phosphatase